MPRRHEVLLTLGSSLAIPLFFPRGLVLVDREHNVERILTFRLPGRSRYLEATILCCLLGLLRIDDVRLYPQCDVKPAHDQHEDNRSALRHVRRENHVLCTAKTLTNEPHLSIKPLHAVLATLHILRILVIDEFRVANVAVERPRSEVDQLVGLERRERFVALRAYITLVIELLWWTG